MEESGRSRSQDACHAQYNEPQVETDNGMVIPLDPLCHSGADFFQGYKLIQVIGGDGNIRHLTGNGRSFADGDSRVRRGEGMGIVNPVTDHDNLVAVVFDFRAR